MRLLEKIRERERGIKDGIEKEIRNEERRKRERGIKDGIERKRETSKNLNVMLNETEKEVEKR